MTNLMHNFARFATNVGRRTGKDLVKDDSERINIAASIQRIDLAHGLFWGHVRRGSDRRTIERAIGVRFRKRTHAGHWPCDIDAVDDFRQAPIQHQDFTERSSHDIARF